MDERETEKLFNLLFNELKDLFGGDDEEIALNAAALGAALETAGYRKADEVRKESAGEIERLKAALDDAIHSFTRMETLYKLKCNEHESAKESAGKEKAKEIWEDFKLQRNHFDEWEWEVVKLICRTNGVEVDE